jgi:hypothetical protein
MYGDRKGNILSPKKVSVNQACSLKRARVNIASNKKIKFGFEFMSAEKSFAVVASSEEERDEWVNCIEKAILEFEFKRRASSAATSPSSANSPLFAKLKRGISNSSLFGTATTKKMVGAPFSNSPNSRGSKDKLSLGLPGVSANSGSGGDLMGDAASYRLKSESESSVRKFLVFIYLIARNSYLFFRIEFLC